MQYAVGALFPLLLAGLLVSSCAPRSGGNVARGPGGAAVSAPQTEVHAPATIPATGTGERAAPVVGVPSIENAWARAAGAGTNSAVYLTIRNRGTGEEVLIGAQSDVAAAVEVHRTTMEGGVMRMQLAGNVSLPAGGTVVLEPGGLHVMLMGLHRPLSPGATMKVTLLFERAGSVEVQVPVRDATQPMQPMSAVNGHPAGSVPGGQR
jgi:periplasmic copper chaperone A